MTTLLDIYNIISEDSLDWSYYNDSNCSIKGKWNDNHDAYSFIKQYFRIAGKEQLFNSVHLEKHKKYIEEHASHTVSTFLLGIKIACIFNIDIHVDFGEELPFIYFWFLTCLYHDIGYAYEENHDCNALKMIQEDGLEAMQEVCDIKYLHSEFITYSREEVDFYLKGRSQCEDNKVGVIDHGISGGLILYDKLRKQFEIGWKKKIDTYSSRKYFSVKVGYGGNDTLFFSNKHYSAYAKAADAIIAHNIWTGTYNQYIEKYDGDKKYKPINKKITTKDELCFLLCLADTFEPIKRGISLEEVCLDQLEQPKKGFKITIKSPKFEDMYERIKNIGEWLEINVQKCEKESNAFIVEI